MTLQSLSSKDTAVLEPVAETESNTKISRIEKCEDCLSFKDFLKEEEEEEEELSLLSSPFSLPTQLSYSFSCPGQPLSVSAISSIPAPCLEVWDKLCTEMVVMQAEGCSSTTFTLQGTAFANSPFQGTTITIAEYSTAPTVFNVSITATQDAIELLQTHMASFFQLLETRNFSFAIHRIDTHLSTDPWHPGKEFAEDQEGDGQKDEDR